MIVFAALHGLNSILAFIGNLFVLLVVITNRQLRNMRYFLLASLALSDFFFAALITSTRAIATALEEWIFGTPWCHGAAYLIRVLHLSTVFHLCAVSWERYNAIVRKPLRYNGHITKTKILLNITLLWIVPAVISLGPFFGWGDYVYNPDVFACEQKWDKQTTFPLAIASFLVPLVVILIPSYKVLKVVSHLQRSAYIIGFQPNEMEDHVLQNQQQSANEVPDASRSKQNQQQQSEDVKELGMVSTKTRTADHSKGIQFYGNSAYHEEPDDMSEGICQKDSVGQRRNAKSAQAQSWSLAEGSKCWSPAKEKGASTCQNSIDGMDNGCSKPKRCLDQKGKQPSRPEPHGRYQANNLAKMELQIEVIEEQLSFYQSKDGTLEDVNGYDKEGGLEEYTQERNRGIRKKTGVIPQSSREVCNENVNKSQVGEKPQVKILKRSAREKGKLTTENEIQNVERAITGAKQELKSQLKEHVPQGDDFDPVGNPERKKGRQPGKTQMRVGILLKEGKAARDVMIIMGAFLVCYLPLWIMAILRCSGKVLPAEAIIATHCVYSSTMVWNPVIYSVRKKEFRKALKKLLKL